MNELRPRHTYSILLALRLILSLVVVLTSAIFIVLLAQYRSADLIGRTDASLLMAAEFAREVLGPNYHDTIEDASSVSKERFRSIVARNDDLCRRLKLQYLWSVLQVNGNLVFTSATHSDLNDPGSPCAAFLEAHHDPASFAPAMQPDLRPVYSSFKNEWGEGRMVLVPRRDARGRMYIFGASVQLTELNAMIRRTVAGTIGIGLGVVCMAFFVALVLARGIAVPIALLTGAAGRIATGDLNVTLPAFKTRELQALSSSLTEMQFGLKTHLALLRESERKYRELVENANSIILRRKAGGEITFFNEFAEKFFGYSKDEILGRSVIGTIVPERDSENHDLRAMVLDICASPEKYEQNENENMRKDGSRVWVSWTNKAIRNAEGNISEILAIGNDITERKRVEEELQTARQRLDCVISSLYAGVLYVAANGTVEYANQAFCDMFGLSEKPDGLRGLSAAEMLQKILPAYASQAEVQALIKKALAQGKPVRGQEIDMRDGRFLMVDHIPLTVDGRSCGRIWHHQDITGRKLMERALRVSEEKFRKAFVTSPDAIIITRLSDGKFVSVNTGFTAMTGYTQEEVAGKTTLEINIWENPRDRDRMVELLQAEGIVNNFETRFITKDGIMHGLLSVSIIDLNGEPHALAITRDITARKRTEEALQAKNDELIRFNYTVSHDLKSPLVTIKTFLGYLAQDLAKADEEHVAQDLGFINTAADRMNALLDELLDLSRVGRVVNPPVEAPLQDLVQEALDLVAGRIAGRGVTVMVTQAPIMLYGDRVRLVEVFQNLVDNAVKFMGEQAGPLVEIGAHARNGEIMCFVRDNGMGIDPRHKDKLFGLFQKLDARSEGTGLGLALVKRIVEVHGGSLWVESEGLGRGACFWFCLPNKKESGFGVGSTSRSPGSSEL